jgi:peptidoglycan/xylan/chitin deacetylase (PgdA/CDA1 family)
MNTIPNLVTVDIDAPRAARPGSDLDATTNALLESLDRANTSATFFVPRAFAETNPALTRRIAEQGHEVACLTTEQPAKAKPYCARFTSELATTRDAIETATGRRVLGHRNASFAVDYESEWTYDVLVDHGIEYDSSRIPPKYVDFGNQPVPRNAHVVRRWGGTLLEIPPSTTDVLSVRMQTGTTANVRGLPLPVWSAMAERRRSRGESLMMHLRASELARGTRFGAGPSVANRRTLDRVAQIVGRFAFTSVANALPELLRAAPIIES